MVRTSVTHSAIASCATFLFLPHFDVICDLLLDRCTATWNLLSGCNEETAIISFVSLLTLKIKLNCFGAAVIVDNYRSASVDNRFFFLSTDCNSAAHA